MSRDTFRSVGELLDRLRGRHQGLATLYERAAEEAEDPRVRRLCRVVAEGEREIGEQIAAFRDQQPGDVVDAWLQYLPASSLEESDEVIEIAPDSELRQVVEQVLASNRALRRTYEQLASANAGEQLRDLFRDLAGKRLAHISEVATSALPGELRR